LICWNRFRETTVLASGLAAGFDLVAIDRALETVAGLLTLGIEKAL